jgi:hypothetical protein
MVGTKNSLRFVQAAMVAAVLVTIAVTRADAASFTEPQGSLIHVATDAQGHPKALTVSVTGYARGALVYVEQCDGVDPNSHDWSPTIDCDLGNSPAAVVVTRDGTATFDPSDPSHRFVPFAGASPQSLFNCVPSGDRAPANGLPSFATCRVRVSTSPTLATPDQIFLALALPRGANTPPPKADTSTTIAKQGARTTTTTRKSGAKTSTTKKASAQTRNAKSVSDASVSVALPSHEKKHSSSSSGLLAVSDPIVAAGWLLVLAGLTAAVVAVALARRRRVGSAAPDRG